MNKRSFSLIMEILASAKGIILGLILGVGVAIMLHSSGIYNTYS